MSKRLTYMFLLLNIAATTWGVIALGLVIGSSWWSASFFYAAWASIPCVVLHFGFSRFGTTKPGERALLISSMITASISLIIIWKLIVVGPIGPLSMLIYLPFPLTQLFLIVPFIWYARRLSIAAKND